MFVKLCLSYLLCSIIYGALARDFNPETGEELQKALDEVKPGDLIQLKPIDYHGDFYIETSGTAIHKIEMKGAHTDDNAKATRLVGNKTTLEIRANYC